MVQFMKEVETSPVLDFLKDGLPCSVNIHHAITLQQSGAIKASSTQKCFTDNIDSPRLVILRENYNPDSDDTLTITLYCKKLESFEVRQAQ